MVRWLAHQGAHLRVADSRVNPPGQDEVVAIVSREEMHCGPFSDSLFEGIDLIAISPGVPLSDPYVARAVARGIPVVGDIELFAMHLESDKSAPAVVAITGSNGKTTVTSMVAHMCKRAGRDAVAAGNISPAVLDVLMSRKSPQIWVLELSSFQLETTYSLKADAATVLNVSEDHLDRYAGMDEYATAKQNVFKGARVQLLNRDDARCMKMSLGQPHTFGLNVPENEQDYGISCDENTVWLMQGKQRLMAASELKVAGLHNVANALAAYALCRAVGLSEQEALEGLKTFEGLPHRVELVCTLQGVSYYDDSKGTNVGASVAALEGLGRPCVMIAGGVGKGQDFSPLKPAVEKHARAVVLIGVDADKIEAALTGITVPVLRAQDMAVAVQLATAQAKPGDAVLLSPACASFDMFKNYAHRAEVFIAEVRKQDKEGAWPH